MMSSLMGGGSGGAGGIANLAGGLVSGVAGLFQRRSAKKMLNSLQRPGYTIPEEIKRSQKMAEMSAQEGLPSAQYNKAMQNIQRQQSNAVSAASDRRSALMAIPAAQQAATDATLNLDVADANARLQNQKTLYGQNAIMGQYKDKAFQINQMQPFQEKQQYAQSLLGAGNQNLVGGIDKALGGAGSMLFGGGMGGSKRKMTAGSTGTPAYYNGYGSGSNYSGFETGYE